jgi:hypothetical protein
MPVYFQGSMETILLSKYSVSSFTQAFLAVLITVYLLTSANKNCSAWRLIVFFGAISGSMLSAFLLMAINTPARVWFGPFQMLVSLAGMVAITQFAYTFPGGESSSRSKRAAAAALIGLLAVAGTASLTFDNRREVSLIVMSGAFAVYTFWPIVVFALQARAFTRGAVGGPVSVFRALRHPVGREAQAHRAFALLMSVLLLLSLLAFAESLSLISLQSLISSLATLYILFLVSFVFVYVNNAPTPSTFMAKLVGIPLVTLILVMGNMGSFILETLEARFDEDRKAELKFALKSVVQEDFAFLPKHVSHVFVYPLESQGGWGCEKRSIATRIRPSANFTKSIRRRSLREM